ERAVPGAPHRLLVVGDRVVTVVRREVSGPVDVTSMLHSEIAARAVESARVVGLDVAAVELVAEDITRPAAEWAIPAIHCPSEEAEAHPGGGANAAQPAAEAILGALYPEGENGRVPVVCITGTNGKTTTTRLIAHLFGRVHRSVGLACSEGIYV